MERNVNGMEMAMTCHVIGERGRQVKAWKVMASEGVESEGMARQGMESQGMARKGKARYGKTRQGNERHRKASKGMA
jgi:hypothetical protein